MALERVGVRAVIEGQSAYLTGARQVESATLGMGNAAEKAANQTSTMAKSFSAVGSLMPGIKLGFAAIGATVGAMAVKTGIGLASMLEQSQIGFTTMLGSGEKAKQYLDDLYEFAARTPFTFKGLVGSTQQLLAMGFAAEEVIPMLTAIGDAAAGLGAGEFGIQRITRALGQMRAKGKVSGEEMRQLAEMGIPAWEILADAIGMSIPEAMKKAETGMIAAADTIPQIIAGMNERFGGLMEKQATSLQGRWSTLMDNFEMSMANAVKGLLPALKELILGATALLEAFGKITPVIGTLAGVLVPVAELFRDMVNGLTYLTGVVMENQQLLTALGVLFGTVLAIRIAAFIREVFMLLRAFGALRVMTLTLTSSLGPLGLALGIAAAAAALLGFNALADRSKKSQEEAAAATRQWASDLTQASQAFARRWKLDETVYTVEQLTRELNRLRTEAEGIPAAARAMGDMPPLQDKGRLREWTTEMERLKDTLAEAPTKVEALETELKNLQPSMEQINQAVKDHVLALGDAKRIWPDFKKWVDTGGGAVAETKKKLEELGSGFESQVDSVTSLTSALKEFDSQLNKLAGVQTQEEAVLTAQSATLDAQIKSREALIAQGYEMTQGQLDELAVWEAQKKSVDAQTESLEAQKDSVVANIQAQANGRPTMEEAIANIWEQGQGYVTLTGSLVTLTDKLNGQLATEARNVQAQADLKDAINNTVGSVKDLISVFVGSQDIMNQYSVDPAVAEFHKLANAAIDAGASIVSLQGIAFGIAADEERFKQQVRNNIDKLKEVERGVQKVQKVAVDTGRTTFPDLGAAGKEAAEKITPAFEKLQDAIDAVLGRLDTVRAAFSALYGRPTKEGAMLALELAKAEQRVTQLRAIGADEKRIEAAEKEVTRLRNIQNLRQSEVDVMKARLDVADQTLLSDTEQLRRSETLIGVMGELSAVTVPVVRQYWEQALAMGGWILQFNLLMTKLTGFPIQGYQYGGTVPGPVGMPQLAVVHGGEQVIPTLAMANRPLALPAGGSALNYAPTFNVTGATLEELELLTVRTVQEHFRRARSTAIRGGAALSSSIG